MADDHENSYNAEEVKLLREQQAKLQADLADLQARLNAARVNNLEQADNEVSTVNKLKLPPFWKENPNLWFGQVEMSFALNKITSDTTKFRHVVVNIDQSMLPYLSDLVEQPPPEGKYDAVKKRIIDTFAESTETKLRRLLRGTNVTDEKPTRILQKLRNFAGKECSDSILRTIFMEHLPENVRTHLVIDQTSDLSKLALQADKIIDVMRPTSTDINAINKSEAQSTAAFAELQKNMTSITRDLAALHRRLDGNKTDDRSRGRSKSRNRTRDDNPDLCYFHARFGEKARKCRDPCNFKKKSEN